MPLGPAGVTPTTTPTNVIVGEAQLYTAPANTPRCPDGAPLGAKWPAAWTAVGSTDAGVKQSFDPKLQDIFIEEQPNPVNRLVDTVEMTVSATLKEDVLSTLLLAWGMGAITAQATSLGRTFADAVFNSTTTMTSATAAFTQADVGRVVTDTTVPATVPPNTYIVSVTNATTVILNQAATLTNSAQSVTLADIPPLNVYNPSTTANQYAVAFEAEAAPVAGVTGLYRRLYLPNCTSASAKIDTEYRRAKAARMYAVQFNYIGPYASIDIRDQQAS